MSQAGSPAASLQGPGKPPPCPQPLATPPLATPPPPPPPRRSRAVACAECRRLKLKCDRTFPCMNCRRREVANLCPHGSLITRSRVTNSTMAEFSGKRHDVKWMLERIARLEEALALVQSQVSDEPHPLLSSAASTRPDGYASGSSEQPESDAFSPPSTSATQSMGQTSKRIIRAEDPVPDDKSRPQSDSAYR